MENVAVVVCVFHLCIREQIFHGDIGEGIRHLRGEGVAVARGILHHIPHAEDHPDQRKTPGDELGMGLCRGEVGGFLRETALFQFPAEPDDVENARKPCNACENQEDRDCPVMDDAVFDQRGAEQIRPDGDHEDTVHHQPDQMLPQSFFSHFQGDGLNPRVGVHLGSGGILTPENPELSPVCGVSPSELAVEFQRLLVGGIRAVVGTGDGLGDFFRRSNPVADAPGRARLEIGEAVLEGMTLTEDKAFQGHILQPFLCSPDVVVRAGWDAFYFHGDASFQRMESK